MVAPGLAGSGFALAVAAGPGAAAVSRRLPPQDRLDTELTLDLADLELGGETILATWSDGRGELVTLSARRRSARRVRLTLRADDGTGARRPVGAFSAAPRRPLRLAIEWRAATAAGAADGFARWAEGGRERGSAGGLATAGRAIKSLEVGFPAGPPPAASGRLLVDDVVLSAGRP